MTPGKTISARGALVAAAAMLAGAATVGLAHSMPEVEELKPVAVRIPPQTEPPPVEDYLVPILSRSLHDADRAGQEWTEDTDDEGPIEADVPFALVGTIAAVPASHSSAMLLDLEADEVGFYAVGDELDEGVVIEAIEHRRVSLLLEDGTSAYLEVLNPSERAELERKRSAGGRSVVRVVQPDTFEVSVAAVGEVSDDPEALLSQITTKQRRGGVRLLRVRPGHPLRKLGIRNGDVIRKIDGKPVGDASGLQEALRSLPTSGGFSVEVRRRRDIRTLHYTVL